MTRAGPPWFVMTQLERDNKTETERLERISVQRKYYISFHQATAYHQIKIKIF